MKIENKIILTFFSFLGIAIIINGLYSIIVLNQNFFDFKMLGASFLMAFIYLSFLYIETRKYVLIAYIAFLSFLLMILFFLLSTSNNKQNEELETIKQIINAIFSITRFIYCIVELKLSKKHAKEIIEEMKKEEKEHFTNHNTRDFLFKKIDE